MGGLERYTHYLCKYFVNKDFEVVVVQKSIVPFDFIRDNIRVIGVPSKQNGLGDYHFNIKSRKILTLINADLYVYSSFQLAFPFTFSPSIAFCHGLWWDVQGRSRIKQYVLFNIIRKLFNRFTNIVFNDTNVINWYKANWPNDDISNKYLYLPNFVDSIFFNQKTTDNKNDDIVRILYPRRLEVARGIFEFMKAMLPILKENTNIEIHVVGIGSEKENLERFIENNKINEKVLLYSLPFDKMHESYSKSDIVVIPSLGSEGTSLSCLEAMASGCCVVSTNVGGLPNLIIDEYNGLLCNPTTKSMEHAIRKVINNVTLRTELSNNAIKVATKHELKNWYSKLENYLNSISF